MTQAYHLSASGAEAGGWQIQVQTELGTEIQSQKDKYAMFSESQILHHTCTGDLKANGRPRHTAQQERLRAGTYVVKGRESAPAMQDVL